MHHSKQQTVAPDISLTLVYFLETETAASLATCISFTWFRFWKTPKEQPHKVQVLQNLKNNNHHSHFIIINRTEYP
jgi:hypothetical protein